VKAIAMILAVTGIAYGANIALTSSGSRTEFGQGFVTTTACDTNGGITIIPYAGFINDTGTGKFSLDSIILENIDAACVGEDFTIQVYGETGDALTVSESATAANGASYVQFNLGRFYFQDSSTVTAIDKSYIDYDILTDTSAGSTEFTSNQSSIQITFDPDHTVSFADATVIRRITIQTVKH
jgi:hypothetical protein